MTIMGQWNGIAGIEKLNRSFIKCKNNANVVSWSSRIWLQRNDNPAWTKTAVEQLEKDVKAGAAGLKCIWIWAWKWKIKTATVTVDDPRLIRLGKMRWVENTGADPHRELGPVFYVRWINKMNVGWNKITSWPGEAIIQYPSLKTVMAEQHHIFKTRNTTFIAAHFDGWQEICRPSEHARLFAQCSDWICRCTEEIGRQPKNARKFL